ncbi:F-box-like domain-containing protein [Legionella cardiaca]|uniref:F-box-like domain-containing protein n=1 Tax=Legionella cardiaca TaxID=1071983 RepID=A0ABY8AWD8_9GAMM|nr:F-box-like domain-containing protein [Legionella cardiaca]WED43467.1 F-box-like domain-containing protein [Legionella cardiaca]
MSNFPPEITLTIFNFFPKKAIIGKLAVCRAWEQIGKDKTLWENLNFEEFKAKTKQLHPDLQELVLEGILKLELAEKFHQLWLLPLDKRKKQLTSLPKKDKSRHFILEESFSTNFGLVIFLSELLANINLATIPVGYLKYLCSKEGAIALGKNLICPDEFFSLPHVDYAKCLLSEIGVSALKEQLINPQQILLLDPFCLDLLLTPNGLTALREHLISVKGIANLGAFQIKCLLSEKGLLALQTGHVTVDAAASMKPIELEKHIAAMPMSPSCSFA